MNTFIKAAVLSISTALIALPALAAPQEQHQQHQTAQSHGHAQKHTSNGHQQPTQCHCQKSQPSISRLESRSKTPKTLTIAMPIK